MTLNVKRLVFSLVVAALVIGVAGPASALSERERKIGQMLMLGFTGSTPESRSAVQLASQIKRGEVGAVVFLGHNFKSQAGVKGLTRLFASASRNRPVFIALDMEGGTVQRLGRKLGYQSVPSAAAVAKRGSPQAARRQFARLASYSKSAGFNMNLAPVVDLAVSPDNPAITKLRRSYGTDPAKVAAYARAFIDEHRSRGIITVLKHFPGHGSSHGDSHDGFVDITGTWINSELKPYRALISSGDALAIMTGHLINKKLDPAGLPASLSSRTVSGLLRGKLKFNGLVISDDLLMSAISKNYGYEDAVIRAVNAGVDLLMISGSAAHGSGLAKKTIGIISRAIDAGRIDPAKIEAADKRIRRARKMISR